MHPHLLTHTVLIASGGDSPIIDPTFDWIMDSGCTSHMCGSSDSFTTLTSINMPITTAGEDTFAKGIGTVKLRCELPGETSTITLTNTLYVPSLPFNLISQTKLDAKFYISTKDGYQVRSRETNELFMEARLVGGLYVLNQVKPFDISLTAKDSIYLWHERLGHINTRRLQSMKSGSADGVKFPDSDVQDFNCDTCKLGKAHRAPIYNKEVSKCTIPGQRTHWDLAGPMEADSLSGSKYVILGVDEATRYVFTGFHKSKSQANSTIKHTIQAINTSKGAGTAKAVHSDNGGEFIGGDFTNWLKDMGIKQTTTAANTPEHNGLAERYIKSIISSARCLLLTSGLPTYFWAEATRMATIVHNVSPSKAFPNSSPSQEWSGKKPNVSQLRTFGCRVLVKDYAPKGKFSIRTWDGIYLGPAEGGDGHRIYNPVTKKMSASRDVMFLEGRGRPQFITQALEEAPDIDGQDGEELTDPPPPSSALGEHEYRPGFAIQVPPKKTYGGKGKPTAANPNSPTPSRENAPSPRYNEEERGENLTGERTILDRGLHEYDDDESNEDLADNRPSRRPTVPDTSSVRQSFSPVSDDKGEESDTPSQLDNSVSSDTRSTTSSAPGGVSSPSGSDSGSSIPTSTDAGPYVTRSGRASKPPGKFWKVKTGALCAFTAKETTSPPRDPTSYEEAINSPLKKQWVEAMVAELHALKQTGTYTITLLPANRLAIGSKWVYRTKRDDTGKVLKYKARLVAQGFRQKKGIDFNETFAPVARMTSQRLVIAIAAQEGLQLYTVDVDNAYLNGDIDAELYMKQPKGFVDPQHPDTSKWVCKLNKSLYGIKQAGNIWNGAIHTYIISLQFIRAKGDLCVYTREHGGTRMVLALHVDDFTIAATPSQFNWFITSLQQRFSIKYQEASMCLGLKIQREEGGGYSFGQQHYLEEVLRDFGLTDCKPSSTPMSKGEVNALTTGDTGGKPLSDKDHSLYRQMVGKLMYAMVGSRPDLAFALSVLGRYADSPNSFHLAMAKKVLAYVKHTINLRLHYKRSGTPPSPTLSGYVDSDYANTIERKSTTGFCFFLGDNLITWCSKKQSTIATSTAVAEYFALYEATTEAVYLRKILADLSLPQSLPTLLREDNQTAIKLSEDETSHKRTKHIDVKYQYTREQQDLGTINIQYVNTLENLADFFTKPFARVQHQEACKQLGLYP